MDRPDHRRVARAWAERRLDPRRRPTPTEFAVQQMRLPVPDARFDRAMYMAARDMGGTYDRNTGTIFLPRDLVRPGDRSFPTELRVLYRKFPCGMLLRNPKPGDPVSSMPCVSFDVIPNVPGDPRRSRIYQSFQGEAATSKTLFGKFLGWLKIISKAVKRYRQQVGQGRAPQFGRLASEVAAEDLSVRVARAWMATKDVDRLRS